MHDGIADADRSARSVEAAACPLLCKCRWCSSACRRERCLCTAARLGAKSRRGRSHHTESRFSQRRISESCGIPRPTVVGRYRVLHPDPDNCHSLQVCRRPIRSSAARGRRQQRSGRDSHGDRSLIDPRQRKIPGLRAAPSSLRRPRGCRFSASETQTDAWRAKTQRASAVADAR